MLCADCIVHAAPLSGGLPARRSPTNKTIFLHSLQPLIVALRSVGSDVRGSWSRLLQFWSESVDLVKMCSALRKRASPALGRAADDERCPSVLRSRGTLDDDCIGSCFGTYSGWHPRLGACGHSISEEQGEDCDGCYDSVAASPGLKRDVQASQSNNTGAV